MQHAVLKQSQQTQQTMTKFTTGPWRLLQNNAHGIVLDPSQITRHGCSAEVSHHTFKNMQLLILLISYVLSAIIRNDIINYFRKLTIDLGSGAYS